MTDADVLVHWLWVHDEPDDERGPMELVHDPRCREDDGLICAEYIWESGSGLDFWFAHSLDDKRHDAFPVTTTLEPGLYQVRAWQEQVRADTPMGPAEWDGGLHVLERDEWRDADPHEWPELEPPEAHQVWVGMNKTPYRREIRGTGALL